MSISELKEKIKELLDIPIFCEEFKDLFNNILSTVISYYNKNLELECDKRAMQELLVETLKSKVGNTIYWASPNWKYETHIISGVRLEILESTFFDTRNRKKSGTLCVLIDVDNNDGYYLADDIGKTLFFNQEEAIKHSKYSNEYIDNNTQIC